MTQPVAPVGGIHHVTAIAGDPQENVEFYAGVLGMRLVKRSVNQDDPGTYHLFYADGGAHPGADLTFFPWPDGAPGRLGTGLVHEVGLAVPPGTLDAWAKRLDANGVTTRRLERFGEPTLAFVDTHGLPLSLTATPRALERPFDAWSKSPVESGMQVRGIHAARIVDARREPTGAFASAALGMRLVAEEDGWARYVGRDAWSGFMDVRADASAPRGSWGVGTVHHVAWRVKDDAEQLAVRDAVLRAGASPTGVIDRFWFHSVYFREPGGVLFELATDGPGFGVDEPMGTLGEALVLPPWLEPQRASIEAALPPIRLPHEPPAAPALSFKHVHEPGAADASFAALLLHGTGADERDLLTLGRFVAPGAPIVSPLGKVREGGAARWFRRFAEGVFDEADLRVRAAELAAFLTEARAAYALPPFLGVGFSNGANMAAGLLLLHPKALAGAVLFRATVPLEPERLPDLAGVPVYLAAGTEDTMIPAEGARRLAEMLTKAGADVTLRFVEAGHGITPAEIEDAKAWVHARFP